MSAYPLTGVEGNSSRTSTSSTLSTPESNLAVEEHGWLGASHVRALSLPFGAAVGHMGASRARSASELDDAQQVQRARELLALLTIRRYRAVP